MRTVLASGRMHGTGGRAVHATLSGAWLGLLSEPQLRELDEDYYRTDHTYRSAAWNEQGLFAWEREAVEYSFSSGSRIAVVACGGGREVLALLRMGFDATGYESHPALRAYADAFLTERGYTNRILPVPRDQFPEGLQCDGALLGWGAYSLIAWREQRVSFLQAAAAGIPKGGRVVLSGFATHAHGRGVHVTARVAGALRRLRKEAPVELGDTLAPNRVHVFTRSQLSGEIGAARLILSRAEVVGAADPVTSYAYAVAQTPA